MKSPSTSNLGIDQVDCMSPMDKMKTNRNIVRVSSIPAISNLNYSGQRVPYGSIHNKLWVALSLLDNDPHPEVAKMCQTVTGYIRNQVKVSTNFLNLHFISTRCSFQILY